MRTKNQTSDPAYFGIERILPCFSLPRCGFKNVSHFHFQPYHQIGLEHCHSELKIQKKKVIRGRVPVSMRWRVGIAPSKDCTVLLSIVRIQLSTYFAYIIDMDLYRVQFVQDLFKLGDGKNFLNVSHLSSKEISSKLSELLNGELIEPILRVWRAYKFSIKHPQCDKRLICHLNQKDGPYKTGLKPGVTKLSR